MAVVETRKRTPHDIAHFALHMFFSFILYTNVLSSKLVIMLHLWSLHNILQGSQQRCVELK